MLNFKLFSKCDGCKKKRLYLSKRTVMLPIGVRATSKDYFCGRCFTPKGKKELEKKHD